MSANAGDQTYTARYAAQTSKAISFPIPVSGYIVTVEDDIEFTITGNNSSSSAAYHRGEIYVSDVNVMANKTVFTLAAIAGTIDISVKAWR